jgi:hypothetical protein
VDDTNSASIEEDVQHNWKGSHADRILGSTEDLGRKR